LVDLLSREARYAFDSTATYAGLCDHVLIEVEFYSGGKST
jgi:hypothetical protein